ncbi:MAG: AMP-dependent synthetase [Alphaproteobacteria bacterium]|nr:AMP-dependent synthetase [Alphaproteobacteria bacterium]
MTNEQNDNRLQRAGFHRAEGGALTIPIPEYSNIAESTVGRHARGPRADRPALLYEAPGNRTQSFTFREIDAMSSRLAAALRRRGVKQGQPVGIHTGQRPETLIAHLACYKLGAVAMTLSQLYGPDTLAHAFRDSGAGIVLTERAVWSKISSELGPLPRVLDCIFLDDDGADGFDRLVREPASNFEPERTRANDLALLMYTSGSTGLPKGLLHGHRVLDAYMPTVRLFYNLETEQPELRFWTPADWAWVGGLLDLVLPALAEGHLVVAAPHRFEAEHSFDLMARHGITHSFMTPTALKRLAEFADPMSKWPLRLATVCTGGESLPSEVIRWCERNIHATCNEFYGLTEFNHLVGNCKALYPIRPGSMGKAYPGHRTTIVDDAGRELPPGETGEIVAHVGDPTLFLGYWGQPGIPERLRLGDWLRTSDLAHRDDQGYFWYQGRNDDLIKTAGYRIGPAEVEDCLVSHEAVAEAAVIGIADAERGSIIKALVRLRPGFAASDGLAKVLQDHVKSRLAAYKYPRVVEFVDEFPLTSSGKIRRGELRRLEADKSRP